MGSMYGIFTCIWLIFMVNVGKYTIHGWYGYILSYVFQVVYLITPYGSLPRLVIGILFFPFSPSFFTRNTEVKTPMAIPGKQEVAM